MRRSELLKLRWFQIDLPNRRIILTHTKNNDPRVVYLNDLATAVLNLIANANPKRSLNDKLIPGLTGPQVSMAFKRLCTRLKIADFRLHDLRHTAASWLRMKGADIHTVALLLGHKDLRMAARYQHLSPDFLQEAVQGLDSVFPSSCYRSVTEAEEKKPLEGRNCFGILASPGGFEPPLPP